nr:ATP-dependent DNA helicase PIF1 [Tanacetum cinerariifolium]
SSLISADKKTPKGAALTSARQAFFMQGIPAVYHCFIPPSHECHGYHAIMWYDERNDKAKRDVNSTFSLCFQEGKVLLPLFNEIPPPLMQLLDYKDTTTSRIIIEMVHYFWQKEFSLGSSLISADKKTPKGAALTSARQAFFMQGNPAVYHCFVPPSHECHGYHAIMWYDERNDKAKRAVNSTFSLCFQEGKVLLPLFNETPPPLKQLLDYKDTTTSRLTEQIRVYNIMFCFTSFGAKIEGVQPRYAQLYFFDTRNEIKNRMPAFMDNESYEKVDENIVADLTQMLDHPNPIVRSFQMAKEWCNSNPSIHFGLRYTGEQKKKRGDITMKEYYAYIIHQRNNQGNTLLKGGRLFQRYLVDAYTTVEEQRLKWTRNNQDTLRVDLYQNLCDAVTRGQTDDQYLKERAILTPRNDDADAINEYMFNKLGGETVTYNNVEEIWMSPHALCLKKEPPIMLIRNMDPTKGICNGTRLIITELAKFSWSALCRTIRVTTSDGLKILMIEDEDKELKHYTQNIVLWRLSTTSMAAPGPSNVIARRVVDELLEFMEISETLIGQLSALIAELEGMKDQGKLFDTLMSLREDKRNENAKLLGLNELIA